MNRRFLVFGVCFLFLGLQVLPARSADQWSSAGRVRQAGYQCRRCCGCGRTYVGCYSCCPYCGTRAPSGTARAPEGEAAEPGVPFVEEEPGVAEAEPMDAAPPAGAVAAAPTAMAPNMIGDFFATGGAVWNSMYMVSSSSHSSFPSPGGPGSIIGSTKIAENSSPMPQDRFFFNYSYFDSTPLHPGDVDVSRFTPGFEKTFLGGNASFEMRFPMAVTLDSTIVMDDVPDTSSCEFGNFAMTPKLLLCRSCCGAVSMGMTITVPTADDINVVLADDTQVARIENEAVHLMPFVGFIYRPNPCWFAQGYLQYDVATTGNTTLVDYDGYGLQEVGYLNDTTFQYLDLGIGRWLYQSCQSACCERLRSVAFTAEVHWNKSLQDGDYIESIPDGYLIGNNAENVDIWDATIGLHVRLCDTTITAAYIAPLTDGPDKPFDGEFRLIVNRWFGRSSEAYGYGAYPGIFP